MAVRGAREALFWIVCAILLAAGSAARANSGLYEAQRVQRQLSARGLEIDPQPEGKRIAFIQLAREDVFADDEVWPVWPNMFHWLTAEDVIRSELLLVPGDRYDSSRIEESTRTLRNMAIFALVRITAVRTRDPGQVGLLVYTRELWTLRLETVFRGTGASFSLAATLTERNLFGRGKLFGLTTYLDPKTLHVGQLYSDRRVLGHPLQLKENLEVVLNRDSQRPEGSQGAVSFGRPFYDLGQRWSWTLKGSYAVVVERSLRGGEVASFRPDAEGRLIMCEEPAPECVRSVWDDRSVQASLTGSYRVGQRVKQTFTASLSFYDRDVREHAETQLAPEQREVFERRLLPRADRQVYPGVRYDLRTPRYVTYFNLTSFGQSEAVQVGPEVVLSVALPLSALGSDSDILSVSSTFGYVLGGDDLLLEASGSASARLVDGRVSDQQLSFYVRGATPSWFAGRLVFRAGWEGRRRDTTQTQAVLGGDNGLRGFQAGAFRVIGGNRMRFNAEYRSLPLVIEAVHLGGVLFYDAGSVYADRAAIDLHHAVGAGARLLFPQLNRSAFRLDLGVPLEGNGFSIVFSYGGEQAVPLTELEDLAAAASGNGGY